MFLGSRNPNLTIKMTNSALVLLIRPIANLCFLYENRIFSTFSYIVIEGTESKLVNLTSRIVFSDPKMLRNVAFSLCYLNFSILLIIESKTC